MRPFSELIVTVTERTKENSFVEHLIFIRKVLLVFQFELRLGHKLALETILNLQKRCGRHYYL